MPDRTWSWAENLEIVNERIRSASQLAGMRLQAVRYFDIDYRRYEVAPEWHGPREICGEQEWQKPTWRFAACDSIDHGVELMTASGRLFSVTWDPPGDREGIGIDEVPLIGSALTEDADVAIWNVTDRSRWAELIGQEISSVEPFYRPWGPAGGFWCSRITLRFPSAHVVLLLGQGEINGQIRPSSDNVAVLHSPITLPPWETRGSA